MAKKKDGAAAGGAGREGGRDRGAGGGGGAGGLTTGGFEPNTTHRPAEGTPERAIFDRLSPDMQHVQGELQDWIIANEDEYGEDLWDYIDDTPVMTGVPGSPDRYSFFEDLQSAIAVQLPDASPDTIYDLSVDLVTSSYTG